MLRPSPVCTTLTYRAVLVVLFSRKKLAWDWMPALDACMMKSDCCSSQRIE